MFDINPITLFSARQAADIQQEDEELNLYNAKKRLCYFSNCRRKQRTEQIALGTNSYIEKQNELLKEMYDGAKADADENINKPNKTKFLVGYHFSLERL